MATQYTDEKKAEVLAELCSGKRITEVAKNHEVPHQRVSEWSRANQDLIDRMRAEYLKDAMVTYALKAFEAATVVLDDVISDSKYRRKQSATQLMTLVNGNMEKALLLLSALNKGPANSGITGTTGTTVVTTGAKLLTERDHEEEIL